MQLSADQIEEGRYLVELVVLCCDIYVHFELGFEEQCGSMLMVRYRTRMGC